MKPLGLVVKRQQRRSLASLRLAQVLALELVQPQQLVPHGHLPPQSHHLGSSLPSSSCLQSSSEF